MTAPPDDDARRWLAALAARVEDDPDLLGTLSDAEAERLLAQEDVRASGVAASIRRRLREAEADALEAQTKAGRSRRPLPVWLGAYGALGSLVSWWWNSPGDGASQSLWRWAASAVAVLVVGASVWALWPGGSTAVGEVLIHRAELASLVGPQVKGAADLPPLARGARDLLAAAEADPPDRPLALDAAEALAGATRAETDPERIGAAAYFAGLAYRLAGDAEEGARWLGRVPEGTAYAARAADLL